MLLPPRDHYTNQTTTEQLCRSAEPPLQLVNELERSLRPVDVGAGSLYVVAASWQLCFADLHKLATPRATTHP